MSELRRRLMVQQGDGGGLPSEYQEVEWMQSALGAYINTDLDITTTNVLKLRVETTITFLGGGAAGFIADGAATGTGKIIAAFGDSASGLFFGTGSSNAYAGVAYIQGSRIVYDLKNRTIKQGESTYQIATQAPGADYSYKYYIFAFNGGSSAITCVTKVYGKYDIFINDEHVRELYPCYRRTDGVKGLYDMINDVFYTNAGTNDFTVGPDVN